ncbi:MAG: twin-arginine translocation signal domain-containing protein, partial [Gammaproteobacteria bacterium]
MNRKPGNNSTKTQRKSRRGGSPGRGENFTKQGDGITRREFLQASTAVAGLGMGLGLGGMLTSCHDDNNGGNGGGGAGTEVRTYLFDFSQMDTSNHDMVMVAGVRHVLLKPVTASRLAEFRRTHPILELLPDARITHWIKLDMPASGLQLCYCQRISHTASDGSWDMVMQFYHFPISALQNARARALATRPQAPVPVKWARHGVSAAQLAALADPVGEDMLKDSTSTATAMVAGHPEVACFQADTAAYIQTSIIGTQSQTQMLAGVIESLGAAEPQSDWQQCGDAFTLNSSGWATLVPVCNPDTGQQATNSQTGAMQYVPVWAQETNVAAMYAITPALASVKADTTLGANVTTSPASTDGIIWTEHDGTTTVDQTTSGQVATSDLGYITKDQSPGHGYSLTVTGVQQGPPPSISITVKNWFVRYLSLYVRYLDDNGDPIAISTLEFNGFNVQELFPLQTCCGGLWNGTYDILLDMLSPEFEILGIPLSSTSASYTIPVPESATSVLILAGGMGNQSKDANPYYDTTIPGATLTGLFDLAIPSLFLALNAAEGIASLTESLNVSSTLVDYLPTILDLFADSFDAVGFGDPAAFESLGVDIGGILLSKAAGGLDSLVASSLSEGETEEDLLDAVPVIGTFLAAISCIGTVSQMAQTSAQVAQSPSTYLFEITLTHDIQVTIHPPGPAGFPSTATYFTVTAQFDDKGTPTTITQDMPGTTVTEPLVVTFKGVPLGGQVTVTVGFYSDDQWLAGHGSYGPTLNVDGATPPLALDITITEYQVPLLPTTYYSHKEVITLNASGEHEWFATTTPPGETSPSGCNPVNGDLCELTGIAVNTTGAGVGYTWLSYNSAVT